jgi:hypothetical protein
MLSQRDIAIQLTVTNAMLVALCKRYPEIATDAVAILNRLHQNPEPDVADPSVVADALLIAEKINAVSN